MSEMFLCTIAIVLFFGTIFLTMGIRAIEEAIVRLTLYEEGNARLIAASINTLTSQIKEFRKER